MKRLIILLLFFSACISARANSDTLLLGSYATYSPPYLYWIAAKNANESYADALKKFSENKFIKWNKNMAFTKGITQYAYWVLIKVKDTSKTNHKYLWSFYHTSCKYEFYEFDSSLKLLNHNNSSTYQTLTQRPYPVRSVSFPFNISGGQTKFLLVKAQSTNTDVLYLDQDIATPEDFLQWEISYTGLLNRYFGFFIFALLVNLLLFLFIKNKIYGWLSVYILFLLVYNISDFSFDVLIFPAWFFKKFILIPKFTWIIGSTACSLIVFNLFTNQKKYFPKWFNISSIFIRVLGILIPLCLISHLFFQEHQNKILVFIRFMGYIILVGAITFQILNLFYISFKKNRAGLFFLFSSGPLIICAFIYLFYLVTSINVFVIWPSNVIIACCYEVILLTIIFTYDYRNKNKDRNRLLEESLISDRKITSAILYSQEEERKRIAQDLHDELGSSLAALKLRLQKTGLEKGTLDVIIKVVDKASADTRNISHNLMPPEFEKTTLEDLLSNHYTKLNSESSTHFHFHISGDPGHFSKEDELIIYRILMEVTGNILKHSGASEATVQLIYYSDQLEVMAEDNGKGMVERVKDGIGLKNIQSRVNYLGGTTKMDSGPGGTTIMIKIPYKLKRDE
jgi:signal transduction histidine kinase